MDCLDSLMRPLVVVTVGDALLLWFSNSLASVLLSPSLIFAPFSILNIRLPPPSRFTERFHCTLFSFPSAYLRIGDTRLKRDPPARSTHQLDLGNHPWNHVVNPLPFVIVICILEEDKEGRCCLPKGKAWPHQEQISLRFLFSPIVPPKIMRKNPGF